MVDELILYRWICLLQAGGFLLLRLLTDGVELCGLLVNYCNVDKEHLHLGCIALYCKRLKMMTKFQQSTRGKCVSDRLTKCRHANI